MEKITKFSEADVGRVAVSEDDHYRIKILSADGDNLKVEYLKEADGCEIGYVTSGFTLVRGSRAMFWADTVQEKNKTDIWFETEPAIFTHGEDLVKAVLREAFNVSGGEAWKDFDEYLHDFGDTLNDHGHVNGIDGINEFDGCSRHYRGELLSFEEFAARLGIVIEAKAVVAKPRFRKPRQKPPVRKKTDVVIQYKTGQTYTLKNVNSVSVSAEKITVGVVKEIEEGIRIEVNNDVDSKLVAKILIKAPGCETEIHNYGDDEFLVYFDDGYCIVRQWFKTF